MNGEIKKQEGQIDEMNKWCNKANYTIDKLKYILKYFLREKSGK